MTPKEHCARGEALLVDAERAAKTGAFDLAQVWSAMAQAHFGAAIASTATGRTELTFSAHP